MGDECRLVFQERIRPAFEDTPFNIDCQLSTLCIQDNLNILTFQPLANTEHLTEQMNFAMNGYLPNEGHATSSNRQRVGRHNETRRQFLKFLAPPILFGCQATQFSLNMLRVDGVLQTLQFSFERADASKMTLEQTWLEPAVEVLHASIGL
jgi:hypothetical protein